MSTLDPAAFVRDAFGSGARWDLLPGDASDRRYIRVHTGDGSTRIAMLLAQPFDRPWVPFERMTDLFVELGIPVPRILERHPDARALVLEDLGDRSLQAHLQAGVPEAEWEELYGEAIDRIVQLQQHGTRAVTPDHPAYHFVLDDVKLGRELTYFAEHYVGGLLEDPLSKKDAATLADSLEGLARRAGRPGDRVLCHRDYHSRNLMLPDPAQPDVRLVVIDHQDARLGGRAYDLASLLHDPYVDVPEELTARMTGRFLAGIGRADRSAAFNEEMAAATAQRTLKAVGTFAGQAHRFQVKRYLPYIPPALASARRAIAGLPGLEPLGQLLDGPLAYRAG